MNNSPVLYLQEMASSSSTDISELLSKAKMISVKLGLKDIYDWIEYEINGYPSDDLLPNYRILLDTPIYSFDPRVGWIPCFLPEIQRIDIDTYNNIKTFYLPNSISILLNYIDKDSDLYCNTPDHLTRYIQSIIKSNMRIAWCISQAHFTNILTNVKSKILDWALLLESKNILGEGLQFSPEEKKEAIGMTVNNNTNNFHGNVNNSGSISSGTTGAINQQNTIIIGDLQSLERKLSEYGIANSDISELKELIENSPKPATADNLGEGIGGWVGNMIGKAYSGSLKIAASAAPVLLTNALCHYYGIPV